MGSRSQSMSHLNVPLDKLQVKSTAARLLLTIALGAGLALSLLWGLNSETIIDRAHAQGLDDYATYYVAPGGNCAGMEPCFASIQEAVDAADHPEDVVKVAAGTYTGVQSRPSPPGYLGTSVVTQVVYVSKTVTVRGGYTAANWNTADPEANPATLNAQGMGRVLYITGDITPTIEGLLIAGGDASDQSGGPLGHDAGGGMYVYTATITVSECTIVSNTASTISAGFGGGLYLENSDATLNGNTMSGNTASTVGSGFGGGLYLRNSPAMLSANTVAENTASAGGGAYGGGLYLDRSNATLLDNVIRSNASSTYADATGGGLSIANSNVTLDGNTIVSNTASTASWGDGGGVALEASAATLDGNPIISNTAGAAGRGDGGGLWIFTSAVTVTDNTVESNIASIGDQGFGGGLYLDNSGGSLTGNRVLNNVASTAAEGSGGGLYLQESNATLENNTVQGNIASTGDWGTGGGLCLVRSDAVVQSNTIQRNAASAGYWGNGGGMYLRSSDATIESNTVQGNTASIGDQGFGGGLYLSHSGATLRSNTVQGNVASTDDAGNGGGLYLHQCNRTTLDGNTVISNTATFSGTASGRGGGLHVQNTNPFTLANNLVAGNHANTQGSGMSILGHSEEPTSGHLLHTTIAHNHGSREGVYVEGDTTIAFTNTIIAGHSQVGITATTGSTVTLEATLWHENGIDTGGGTILTGTLNVWGNPAFIDPAVWDYHLAPGSAAIDAGVNAGVATDRDGTPRPQGSGYDIGAYEFRGIYLPLVLRNR
jgi:fibronectin-binding autotransporter adhesin